jgi:hypothetical protein
VVQAGGVSLEQQSTDGTRTGTHQRCKSPSSRVDTKRLLTRYKRTGVKDDVGQGANHFDEALRALPADYPDRRRYESDGGALSIFFGLQSDLDQVTVRADRAH